MSQQRDQQLRIAAARADFLEFGPQGAAGVDDVVAASWSRSRSAGVDADRYEVAFHSDVDFDSRLARCARPVIDRLADDMSDIPVTIAFTDAAARIVDRRDCSTAVGRVLDRVDFALGFSFDEGSIGTNGVGTVFEVGAPVSVVGSEHFNQALTPFACAGTPIWDPLTRRMAGVLDVSMLSDSWNPLIEPLIRAPASDIGRNLLLDRSPAKRALFETFLRADTRPRQAVMAVGDTVMANEFARDLLTPDEQASIAQFAEFLMSRHDRSTQSLTLPGGRRIRLRTNSISCNGDTVGMVILLDEEQAPDPVMADDGPRTLPALPSPDIGVSPAWRSARTEVLTALTAHEAVLVLGESGTGRCTLVGDVFGSLHEDAPVIVVDATADDPEPLPDLGPGPALVVLRNLDRMPAESLDAIDGVIRAAIRAGHDVAATMEPVPDSPRDPIPHSRLLFRFDRSVAVPPLRLRTADLPAVVDRVVKTISPQRSHRLSPKAMRMITGFHWPGNIVQLREALEFALRRRPVGEIQPEDLPGFCRSTAHRALTPLESAERDAIIAALESHGGNRLHAAAALGMSRSTLYRKLRVYGILSV